MKNALILHGTNANSKENWFPWLKQELEKDGYKVWVPDLPHADKPNIERYNDFVFPKWKFDKDSIIIGHSSGAVAILGLLQEMPEPISIDRAFLVAGFFGDLGWEPLREIGKFNFNWKKIKQRAKKFILIHSDDDPYVQMEYGHKLRDFLGAELIILPGHKHFSVEDSPVFNQFPELLEKILE